MAKIIVTSGFFNPLHKGHIECFKEAKKLGDKLIVGINSDAAQIRKSGKCFMSLEQRRVIIQSLKYVDEVRTFNDDDGSARDLLLDILHEYPNDEIVFIKGGDRTKENIPEIELLDHVKGDRLKFVFSVGGSNKMNSSSEILKQYING